MARTDHGFLTHATALVTLLQIQEVRDTAFEAHDPMGRAMAGVVTRWQAENHAILDHRGIQVWGAEEVDSDFDWSDQTGFTVEPAEVGAITGQELLDLLLELILNTLAR